MYIFAFLSFYTFCILINKTDVVYLHVTQHSTLFKIKTQSYVDDETRVILETDENNPGDYINASFINVQHFKFYAFLLLKLMITTWQKWFEMLIFGKIIKFSNSALTIDPFGFVCNMLFFDNLFKFLFFC